MNREELAICLEAGFIDFNIDENKKERFLPKILTNNQKQQVKVLESLLSELKNCDEFFFSVAFVTNSGIACLADTLNELQHKNIKGKILASQYQNFTEPRALRRLLKFPNIEVKIITADYNFHAKGYLFHRKANEEQSREDSYNMIIGSSNLTQTALTVNREWNVQLSSMKNGALIKQMQQELEQAWEDATVVDEAWISAYETIYKQAKTLRRKDNTKIINLYQVNPNKMQVEALSSLADLRKDEKDRALLISATGTGKTFLSAFDVKVVAPKRFLFVVHRNQIAKKAKESFEKIIGSNVEMGMFSGSDREVDKPYLFATVQTLSREEHLKKFSPDHFDYIVIDEVHRAGADTYQKIINYFKPKFLLGMTATPERTDGYDIFKDFDYNIAYEIRLNQALEENMLVPFHYHGISEVQVNGTVLDEHSDFNRLTCDERVKHILHYADFYGCDEGRVKGLVFCSRKDEAIKLAEEFCKNGKKSIALTGDTSNEYRTEVVERLESDTIPVEQQIDYIFTVDIFNEGIDIPSINQIIMLRPTQSAIIFVQQLGRGLRKNGGKRYLEVIDFIGNYENNYLLPIALFGDRSYNKEKVRRTMHNNFLPGASTVYFDDIVKERIYASINSNKISDLGRYKDSYRLVKFKVGRTPLMMDFVKVGDKDPYIFVLREISGKKLGSYYHFKQYVEREETTLNEQHEKLLKFLGLEVCNGKRLEEAVILKLLLKESSIDFQHVIDVLQKEYKVASSFNNIKGAINVLSMNFLKDDDAEKYGNVGLVIIEANKISFGKRFRECLRNTEFKMYVEDNVDYSLYKFMSTYNEKKYFQGFKLYENYSRKDVLRLLNWEKDESSTVYGYRVKYNTCPMFVTYEKNEGVSASTNYKDFFISPSAFNWMSRNRVTLNSSEIIEIERREVIKLLFIKKSDDEGKDFYFMGEVDTRECIQDYILDSHGNKLSVVNVIYDMKVPVNEKIYSYFEG